MNSFDDGADQTLGFGFDPMSSMRGDLMDRIGLARDAVKNALSFGRKQNGLEGLDEQLMAYNPSQSDSPREAPGSPIGGGTPAGGIKPFGTRRVPPPRTSQLEGEDDGAELGFNPSQSDTGAARPLPGPGTMPAPANPFGRRSIPPARTSEADEEQNEQVAGAIPETDEEDQEYA